MNQSFLAVGCCAFAIALGAYSPSDDEERAVGKLPDNWSESVTVKDLKDELSDSASRIAPYLKKSLDFDRFLKDVKTEGHLSAILAALVLKHPEAEDWKGPAAEIQSHGLAVAKAAEAKGMKNYRLAQEAHKRITEQLKRSSMAGGAEGVDDPDWLALGSLSDVMKRVEASYKFIRGNMSTETAFKRDVEAVRHHAAMLYVYGHIAPAFRPTQGDMPKLSNPMAAAALEMIEAAKTGDFEKAREANTAINASCNDCHKAKRFQKKGFDFDF